MQSLGRRYVRYPMEVEAIRQHVQRQHAYGTEGFRAVIETQLGRMAETQVAASAGSAPTAKIAAMRNVLLA